jgi:hypothetical protein
MELATYTLMTAFFSRIFHPLLRTGALGLALIAASLAVYLMRTALVALLLIVGIFVGLLASLSKLFAQTFGFAPKPPVHKESFRISFRTH